MKCPWGKADGVPGYSAFAMPSGCETLNARNSGSIAKFCTNSRRHESTKKMDVLGLQIQIQGFSEAP